MISSATKTLMTASLALVVGRSLIGAVRTNSEESFPAVLAARPGSIPGALGACVCGYKPPFCFPLAQKKADILEISGFHQISSILRLLRVSNLRVSEK